jgi:hypothetical protein
MQQIPTSEVQRARHPTRIVLRPSINQSGTSACGITVYCWPSVHSGFKVPSRTPSEMSLSPSLAKSVSRCTTGLPSSTPTSSCCSESESTAGGLPDGRHPRAALAPVQQARLPGACESPGRYH